MVDTVLAVVLMKTCPLYWQVCSALEGSSLLCPPSPMRPPTPKTDRISSFGMWRMSESCFWLSLVHCSSKELILGHFKNCFHKLRSKEFMSADCDVKLVECSFNKNSCTIILLEKKNKKYLIKAEITRLWNWQCILCQPLVLERYYFTTSNVCFLYI